MTWRDRYVQLCREGETAGHTAGALGHYISQRLTDRELLDMLREWEPALERARLRRETPPQPAPHVIDRETRENEQP